MDNTISKVDGRRKSSDKMFMFSVLCESRSLALQAFEALFNERFTDMSIDDGYFTIRVSKIDSRNFCVQYLMLDGMKFPLYLTDVKSNFRKLHIIFPNGHIKY